jgi:hypothetical protein
MAPEFGSGAVVKGNAAVRIGHVHRDRQSLEQLRLGDHGICLALLISKNVYPTSGRLRPPSSP